MVGTQTAAPPNQAPGSFYVGNLSALEHNVRHHEECKHTFDGATYTARSDNSPPLLYAEDILAESETAKGTAKGDQRLQIAVMIRSDVFREVRARKIDATPGPADFFRVMTYTVAQHLADVPVALPDLKEVLAEVARTDSEPGVLLPPGEKSKAETAHLVLLITAQLSHDIAQPNHGRAVA